MGARTVIDDLVILLSLDNSPANAKGLETLKKLLDELIVKAREFGKAAREIDEAFAPGRASSRRSGAASPRAAGAAGGRAAAEMSPEQADRGLDRIERQEARERMRAGAAEARAARDKERQDKAYAAWWSKALDRKEEQEKRGQARAARERERQEKAAKKSGAPSSLRDMAIAALGPLAPVIFTLREVGRVAMQAFEKINETAQRDREQVNLSGLIDVPVKEIQKFEAVIVGLGGKAGEASKSLEGLARSQTTRVKFNEQMGRIGVQPFDESGRPRRADQLLYDIAEKVKNPAWASQERLDILSGMGLTPDVIRVMKNTQAGDFRQRMEAAEKSPLVNKETDVSKSAEFGVMVNEFMLGVKRGWTFLTADISRNLQSPFSREKDQMGGKESASRFMLRQMLMGPELMPVRQLMSVMSWLSGNGSGVPATQTIPAPKSGQTPADAGARGSVPPQTQQIFNDQRRIEIHVDGAKDPRQTAEEVERRLSQRTGASPSFGVMTPGWGAAAVG